MYKKIIFLCLCLCASFSITPAQGPVKGDADKRLLIVSGGGATGAWGGGVAEALNKQGYTYDAVIGSSTGSLIAPFVLAESFDSLKAGYTSITDKDIFNVRPFKTKGKNKGKLRMGNALIRIISPKKTLGESKNLRKTIKRFFTQQDFDKIRADTTCDFYVTVVNVLADQVEYKSIHDERLGRDEFGQYDSVAAYETYVNWIWASANFPVFMSLFSVKDEAGVKQYYFDGGIKESIPLEKGLELARDKGYRSIDVIIHSTSEPELQHINSVNKAMKLLGRTIDIFRSEVRQNDVKLSEAMGKLEVSGKDDPIDIRIFYMSPQDAQMIPNQLIFDQDKMKQLWEIGTRIFEPNRFNQQVIQFKIDNDRALTEILR